MVAPTKAFNIRLMNVDAFIQEEGILEVTDPSPLEPGTSTFSDGGLFSESIFGQILSTDRLYSFGCISLNMEIITPLAYKHLCKMSSLYEEILSGRTYARFDKKEKIFIKVLEPDEEDETVKTGYLFFMEHYPELVFTETDSDTRKNRVKLLNTYRKESICNKIIVLPAGLRDMSMDKGHMIQDDINKLYTSLLQLCRFLDKDNRDTVFDTVRFQILKKVLEIFDYIEEIITGKHGYLQGGGYGRRRIALGTRNVITAAAYVMSDPDDVQSIKPDETKLGIFQTAKGLQPVVKHYIKTAFIDPILGNDDEEYVAVTNTKTFKLEYVDIPYKQKDLFTEDGIEKWINRYRNVDVRFNPVVIKNNKNIDYYLLLVYDQDTKISLFRSIDDLKSHLGKDIDLSKIRPLTWIELLYMATYNASINRHCIITRDPVIEEGSSYPSKIHLVSTLPGRVVDMVDLITNTEVFQYPQYPIMDNNIFLDSTIVHSSSLIGLGGDYDGDMVSVNYLMADDANEEIANYLSHTKAWLLPEKKMLLGGASDIIKLSMLNMTR